MIFALVLLLMIAMGYQLAAAGLVRRFLIEEVDKFRPESWLPPVSQLKPVNGSGPASADCFLSFARQDYPAPHELILTSAREQDAGLELARELDLVAVPGPAGPGANRKVAALVRARPSAVHPILVVSDADMLVPPDYLQRVASSFADPQTGMVTALYAVRRVSTPAQALEGLSVADFCASVLVARKTEGISFGLGATMAFRAEVLGATGGFEAVLDHLADDYQLGHRIASAGYGVRLAPVVVEDVVGPTTFRDYMAHQLRWMRTYRVSRPGGHFAFIVTQGLPWALGLVAASRGEAWSWALAGLWLTLRTACSGLIWRWLGARQAARWVWLTPVKDALYLCLWALSFAGDRVEWAGRVFRVRRDGTMEEQRP